MLILVFFPEIAPVSGVESQNIVLFIQLEIMQNTYSPFDWGFFIVIEEKEKVDLMVGERITDSSCILEFAFGNLFHEFYILYYSNHIYLLYYFN